MQFYKSYVQYIVVLYYMQKRLMNKIILNTPQSKGDAIMSYIST